jgi:hypothetical protein
MRNAMDSQEVAIGWWPGDPNHDGAAFYAYAHPAPEAYPQAVLQPPAAHWSDALGEFVLEWSDIREAEDPHGEALRFAASAFAHSCDVCQWEPALSASAQGTPPPVQ